MDKPLDHIKLGTHRRIPFLEIGVGMLEHLKDSFEEAAAQRRIKPGDTAEFYGAPHSLREYIETKGSTSKDSRREQNESVSSYWFELPF